MSTDRDRHRATLVDDRLGSRECETEPASGTPQAGLPSGRTFHRRFTLFLSVAGVGGATLILFYLLALLRLPDHQLRGFLWMLLGVTLALGPLMNRIQYRVARPLVQCLDDLAAGKDDRDSLRAGFTCVLDLPRRIFFSQLGNFVGAVLVLVPAMAIWFPDFTLHSAGVLTAAAVSGGLLSTMYQGFVLKRWLEPILTGLVARLPDADERDALVVTLPLAGKLAGVMLTLALVPSVFAVFLAHSRALDSAAALALEIQRAPLSRAVSAFRAEGAEGVRAVQDDLVARELPVVVSLVDLSGKETPDSALPGVDRAWLRGHGGSSGSGMAPDGVLRWSRVDGERAIVARTPRTALASAGSGALLFGALLLGAALVACLGAWLVSMDMSRAVLALRTQAEWVAAGRLDCTSPFEAEDELGRLGRAFERMSVGLRSTVGGVAAAAGGVEATANDIAEVARVVALGGSKQSQHVERVAGSMEEINSRADDIGGSADKLLDLAEQSASSTLEVGAASEELRQTAEVLSGRIEEVSSSIDQMVRSASEVRDQTDALGEAAVETSSSMEEMASAMRQVDRSAEKTAELSRDVVAAAGEGRDKVRRTIDGMDSIRTATDAAEQVIRSLGRRTGEMAAIVDVIDEVADETNLLALNAAIISAQAGEQGRPFAVVADEIKSLAERVLASTKEIGGQIHAVQTESEAAIGAIEEGTRSVASGVDLSTEAGQALDHIDASARESGQRIEEIVRAVREQTKAAAHVVGLMERVNEGMERISAASDEQSRGNQVVHTSAGAMRDVAEQLRRTTGEQARGSSRIHENVEGVRDSVESIREALTTHHHAFQEVGEVLDRLVQRNRGDDESVERLERATQGLLDGAAELREHVQRFRLGPSA